MTRTPARKRVSEEGEGKKGKKEGKKEEEEGGNQLIDQ
jgi:hypothetical protein